MTSVLIARCLLSLAAATVWSAAACADIYQSTLADGSVRFSTDFADPTSVLILRGKPEPAPSVAPSHYASNIARQLAVLIDRSALQHGIDPSLVHAVIDIESHSNPRAVSPKGAVGAMQLMPATALRYGVTDRADPAQNIDAGIRYLKDLLTLHQGNVALALASYNAGEGSVVRHGRRIPPYRETMLYVPAVLARLQAHRASLNP